MRAKRESGINGSVSESHGYMYQGQLSRWRSKVMDVGEGEGVIAWCGVERRC